MQDVKSVYLNVDSKNKNVFAVVTKDNGNHNLNLLQIPDQGVPTPVNGVPHREPPYEDGDDGASTWHEDVID